MYCVGYNNVPMKSTLDMTGLIERHISVIENLLNFLSDPSV